MDLLVSVSENSGQEDVAESMEITKLTLVSCTIFFASTFDNYCPKNDDISMTTFQEFACVSGTFPTDEECSEVAMQFWEHFLVRLIDTPA